MENKVKEMFDNTDLTMVEIASSIPCDVSIVRRIIRKNYTMEQFSKRKSRIYKNSKIGDKNPMKDKFREQHHNYVGDVSDGKGYIMCLKPDWYTGRQGCKHVFKHHLVMCEALGLTEIPRGYCIHHIDGNKINNSLENLSMLSLSAHTRLHQLERATTSHKA